ncbi:MAG: radical SAM protein [Deltaproteobacteria bacterium]|nr:radical SAM protein [Deltaproteobacteria bacterium]
MARPVVKGQPPTRRELLDAEGFVGPRDPGGRLSVALVWPGTYRSGMSALGFMWVYGYLNGRPDVLAERFFLPPGQPAASRLVSLESRRPLGDFDLIAASLTLENDYWLLPRMLSWAGLAPERRRRDGGPLVLAGGVGVWSNPWPLMDFVDLALIGEGELQWPALADLHRRRDFLTLDRRGRLEALAAEVPGALAPELLSAEELSGAARPPAVAPAVVPWPFRPDQGPPVSPAITPYAEFARTALVEISRGCPWGCRFCLAGFLYRPHRIWPLEAILAALAPFRRPGGRAGLVSSAVAEHPDLDALLEILHQEGLTASLSSMRLTAVTEKLARRLAQGRLLGLAVAPEGATAELRAAVNKNLDEEEMVAGVRLLALAGLRRLKLYFLLGLPGETDDDLEAMAALAGRLHRASRVGRGGRGGPLLAVSAANFTPKPHTPLEEAALLTEEEMRRRGRLLTEHFRRLSLGRDRIELRLDPPRWSLIQGLLARGGPQSGALVKALADCDGRAGPALAAVGYESSWPVHRPWEGPKPWRATAPAVGWAALEREKALAESRTLTPPCPAELGCGRCAACGSEKAETPRAAKELG